MEALHPNRLLPQWERPADWACSQQGAREVHLITCKVLLLVEGHRAAVVSPDLHWEEGEEAKGVVQEEAPTARDRLHRHQEASRMIHPVAGQGEGPEEGPRVLRPAPRLVHREPFAALFVTAIVSFASVSLKYHAAVEVTRLQEAPRPVSRNLQKTLCSGSARCRLGTTCCC